MRAPRALVGPIALVVTTLATVVVITAHDSLSSTAKVALVATACVAYLGLVTRRRPSGLGIRVVGAAVVAQTIAALAVPPKATADLMWYAMYGRILGIYHQSPYTHTPSAYPFGDLFAFAGRQWQHTPSVYGPAFTVLSGLVAPVLGSSLLTTRLFYQGLAAVALLAVCVLIWRRTRSADAVAFVALNPVTALYLVNGGRNDILVGLALLVAVLLASRRPRAAGLVGGIAALVKLTGLVGVVALVASLAITGNRRSARQLSATALVTIVLAHLAFSFRGVLTPMDTAGSMVSSLSIWRLTHAVLGAVPPTSLVLGVLGLLVCWVLLRSSRSGPEVAVPATQTALTLGSSYALPGYVAWSLPVAALRHRDPVARVVAFQSALLVAMYEVVRHPPGGSNSVVADVTVVVGRILVLALLARLLWCLRRRPPAPGHDPHPFTSEERSMDPNHRRTLVVVPTLDERDNIERLLRALAAAVPAADVLVVDDDSTDGTADLAEAIGHELGTVHVMRRRGTRGIGGAYRAGFQRALDEGYDTVVEMDADLSHDPATVPALLAALDRGADLAIGTRYIEGGSTPGWSFGRRLLSHAGGTFARLALGLPSHDPTSGFRAFRSDLLAACEVPTVQSDGFAFQVEMVHRAARVGARIAEVPIVFQDRSAGQSKMSRGIVFEALRLVTTLRRRPWQPSAPRTPAPLPYPHAA